MTATQPKLIRVPVTLEMTEKEYEQIVKSVEGEAPESHKVAAFANQVLSEVANGAMLLPESTIRQLQDIDPDLDTPDAIVDAVEHGTGVVDGEMVIHWPTDPALLSPLQQQAESTGVTVERFLRDMMDNVIAMGWCWDFSSTIRYFFFTHEEAAQVEEIVGQIVGRKEINAADILTSLRLLLEQPASENPSVEDQDAALATLTQLAGRTPPPPAPAEPETIDTPFGTFQVPASTTTPEGDGDDDGEEDTLPDLAGVGQQAKG